MPRRPPSLGRTFAKAYQRQLKAVTGALTRAGQGVATRVRDAAAESTRPPPGPGDWLAGIAFAAGGACRYHLFVPPPVPGRPVRGMPLVVMLHGCRQTARDFAIGSRMNALARREGFLVLYPQQSALANPEGCWNWFSEQRADAEVELVLAAIDQACLLYGADASRIAVAGLSAGAGLAARLAMRAPERLQAVMMHSGVAPGAATSARQALGAMSGRRAPVLELAADGAAMLPPLLVVQGGRDTVVRPAAGRLAAEVWARAVGAEVTDAVTQQRGKRHPMQVTDFRRGRVVEVRLVEIEALGHAWSGGSTRGSYTDPAGPDASRLFWDFARRAFAAACTPPGV